MSRAEHEKGIFVNSVNIVDRDLTDSVFCVGESKGEKVNYVRQEKTRSVKGLKVALANVRDLLSSTKFEELETLCEEEKLDIVAITESWSTPEVGDSELALKGYTLFRKDREREVEQKGGGVLLYIRENLVAMELLEWRRKECEAVWVEVKGENGTAVCIGVCYRSPTASAQENEMLLEVINNVAKSKVLLLVGDFNYPMIDWVMQDSAGPGMEFLDVVQDNFLWQHVDQATRGDNILDLVLSTERNLVEDLRVTAPIGRSDHVTVQFELCLEVRGGHEINFGFDYRRADYVRIAEELDGKDWNEEFNHESANGMWNKFVDILNDLKVKYVPRYQGKGKRKPKWMDYRSCRALKKKYHAWKRYTSSPSYQGYVNFKRDRNAAINELRRSKRRFEERLAENIKTDSKTFFRYVRSKVGSRDKIGPLKDDQGARVDDDRAMGELLNKFFSSVFTRNDNRTQVSGSDMELSDDSGQELWITEELTPSVTVA